jgi:trehalose-6-phosphate synthase
MARFRLVIVANRAYADHDAPAGAPAPEGGAGGLVTVVRPAVGEGTAWVGAGRGRFDREYVDERGEEWLPTPQGRLRHRRVFFSADVWRGFYELAANAFLWPLLHLVRPFPHLTGYYPRPLAPAPDVWSAYRAANEAYAEAAAAMDAERAWVHDYQLGLVPALLRERGFRGRIGFFVHTPFPEWSVAHEFLDGHGVSCFREWLRGVLAADLVGVQSPADVRRLCEAAVALGEASACEGGLRVGGRSVAVEAHPVGPDAAGVLEPAQKAPDPPWLAELRALGLPLVVGLERADYTKGIPERLRAVAVLLREGHRFIHVGVEAPTRESVPGYEALAEAIEGAAAEAREAARAAGLPFEERREALPWAEVVALLRAADVVVAPSLADGMNLVPLQAVLAQSLRPQARRAVLLVGADTGVAAVYGPAFAGEGLVAVDPLDESALAAALAAALAGRPGRISDGFAEAVRRRDARAWAAHYLARLEATHADV